MATTTSPTGRRNYVDFDEYIDFQLRKTQSGIKTVDILTALAGVATLFLAYLLAFVVFDHWIVDGGFSPPARWMMLGGLLVACAVWIVWMVILPSRKRVTGLYAAKTIETTDPGLKHSLLNLVDLRRSGKPMRDEISRAMEKQAAVKLAKVNVDAAVDRRRLLWLAYAFAALLILCCAYALFSPKEISASVWRALFPSSQTTVDTKFKIHQVLAERRGEDDSVVVYRRDANSDVQQHRNLILPARSKVVISVDLGYRESPPEKVTLYYSTVDDKRYRDEPVAMKPDPNKAKRYRAELNGIYDRGILQDMTYRIEAGDAKAGPFEITVVRPPLVTVQRVRYDYPQYMNRPPKTQTAGHIDTWEGTTVTVAARADRPVTDAWLVFTETDDTSTPLKNVPPNRKKKMRVANGTMLSVTLSPKRYIRFDEDGSHPRFYHIKAIGKAGLQDPDPAVHGVTIRRDAPPVVELVDPEGGTTVDLPANTETLPLLFTAKDPDFQLRYVTLRVADRPQFDAILFDGHKKSVSGTYDFDLRPLGLKPGGTVKFRLEARDNKHPEGNRGFSKWVVLRVVESVPEPEVRQQLEQNRQRQKQLRRQNPENNDGDQNAAEQPQDQDAGKNGNGKQQTGKQDGNKTGQGTAKQKKDDGNTGKTRPGDGPNEKTEQPQDGNGRGTRQNPDGNRQPGPQDVPPKTDADKLRKLLRDQKQNPGKTKSDQDGNRNEPSSKKKQPDDAETPNNQTDDNAGPKPDRNKQQPNDATDSNGKKKDGTQKSPNDPKNPAAKKQPDQKPDQTDPKNPDNTAKKKQQGPAGSGKTDNQPGGNTKTKNTNGGGTGAPKKNMTDNGENGPDTKQPGAADDPNNTSGNPKRQTDHPGNGEKKQVPDDGSPARNKKATGDETGTADPNNDPNANPTRSKNPNELNRRKGTKPAKRKSTGQTDSNNAEKKNRSPNPENVSPKTGKKKVPENTADKTTPPKDNTDRKTTRKPNDRKDPGSEDLKGKGRKNGQESKKPNRGERGNGTPSDQGNKGSNQKGAGDTTKQPGKRQDSNGKKTGQPGSKSGPGSNTQRKPADNPDTPNDGSKGGKQPGDGGVPNENRLGKKKTPRPGSGTGPQAGGNGSPGPGSPEQEQADLDYGKKAANLALNRLENQVKRGDVDKEWLKKHGWNSKKDALDWAARQRRRINNAEQNGDTQTLEMLKSLRDLKFQSGLQKRSGENVRKKALPGVRSGRRLAPPPHLKNYYRAFRRSVNR